MSSASLRHIAIIMDGNNRWAKRQGKQGIAGHRVGVERIRNVLTACRKDGVETLTLFAFSSENWRRPPKEVEALMGLFYSYLKKEARKLAQEGVRLKVIGNRTRFSPRLCDAIEEAESIADGTESTLAIAADYGGCWDIVQASQKIAQRVAAGEMQVSDITEQTMTDHISTAGLPPLDLLIRTGGEYRISNFLLWQAAYAELYFSDLLWPEFDDVALRKAMQEFYSRQRRFGKNGDQIEKEAATGA
ncbi:polyprenyl diphosphate synthase [Agarilytica rhodophyticola]|uniref:polyprenyl diphosphate synthase n=1 Tax=Agarilytica rhodophyticola TaxID=1737490 RepID=UPI000B346C1E|nr:polyprenyl diphosphate synthase [Agarilytica rhodophyticola]